MDPNAPKVACPHCGERNAVGSNVCGSCLRDIRRVGNPNREDLIETHKTRHTPRPMTLRGLWRRMKRWLGID
jgi:hypothetical protein